MHDESSRKHGPSETWPPEAPEDRDIHYPNDPSYPGRPTVYQDTMDILSMTTLETEQFLNRYFAPQGSKFFSKSQVADIKMAGPDGYAAWLKANYGVDVQ